MTEEIKDNVVPVEQASTEGSVEDSQAVETTTETPVETGSQETETTVETNGESEESAAPKQSKEDNSYFKSMRIRAEKEAEAKLEDRLKEKLAEEMTKFKGKLAPVLPDGYSDVDEYLKSLDEDVTELETAVVEETKKTATVVDDKLIEELVAKKLESIPEFKAMREGESKKKEDEFIINSFEEVKSKFTDIKAADDVPLEVWALWDVGKSGRSLLSCMKEYRYDNDIVKAQQKGAATTKSQLNSVAHTGAVNGGNSAAVHIEGETQVPPETQKMMKSAGIPQDKWAEYYKKYHRS